MAAPTPMMAGRSARESLLRVLRSRVGRRLLLWTLLFGGIGTLLVSAWDARQADLERTEADTALLASLGARAAPLLAHSLWAFDEPEVRRQLDSIMQVPDVTAVSLQTEAQGDWQLGASVDSRHRIVRETEIVHVDSGQRRLLGRLTLVKDLQASRAELLHRWVRAAAGNALVILLSALGSVLLYHLVVTRRLLSLARELRAVTPEDLLQTQPPMPMPTPRPRGDELDELAASVATLQATGHEALRRNAEQTAQLREAEARWRAIVSRAGDGILVVDVETQRIIEANEASCRMQGMTREALLDRRITDVVTDFSPEETVQVLRGLGGPVEMEVRHRHADGHLFDVHTSLTCITLQGRACVMGIWRDVSRDKAAREAVESAAAWHRALIENTVEGVAIFDPEGCLIECNERFSQMLGYSQDELLARHPWDWDMRMTRAEIGEALLGRESCSHTFDTRHRRKDGSEYPAEVSVQSTTVAGRQIYVSLTRDISSRVQAADALRQLNAELEDRVQQRAGELRRAHSRLATTQFAMDAVGIGIHWVDPDSGRIVWANRAAVDLLDCSVEQLQSMTVPDIDPGFPPDAFDAVARKLRAQGRLRFETAQRRRDGTLVPVELTIHYHPGDEATPPLLVVFVSDIRQRKAAEQALQQAKEAAESANLAKTAFLANMSHEIRTPLNAITGMAHLVRREGLAPRQIERMDKLQAAGEHLLSVIDAILELSKIEAGKFELAHEPVRVESLLGNVASMLHDRAAAKGLVIATESQGIPPNLAGDATRLQQALLNYAVNAIKFTAVGRVHIRASCAAEDGQGALLRFEVRDSGIGIEPEVLPRLFHAFEQADNSMTRAHGGTGLGLAITRKIAQLMGGDAGASSVRGVGSTFWFTARLARTTVAPTDQAQPSVDAERRLRRDFAGCRVLLAEDEPVNREVAIELLSDVGLQVDAAHDGLQAMAMARDGHHDLVLMDMQMPGLDGLAATRAIRRLPGWAHTPIVAMTANAFDDDRRACREAGMDDFISKPVEASLLFETVARWLEQGQARRQDGEREGRAVQPS